MLTKKDNPTYLGHALELMEPHDGTIDLTRFFEREVFATEPVMRTIDAHAPTLDDKDRIMYEVVYMAAATNAAISDTLSVFKVAIGGEWRSYYAHLTGGAIVISRAT